MDASRIPAATTSVFRDCQDAPWFRQDPGLGPGNDYSDMNIYKLCTTTVTCLEQLPSTCFRQVPLGSDKYPDDVCTTTVDPRRPRGPRTSTGHEQLLPLRDVPLPLPRSRVPLPSPRTTTSTRSRARLLPLRPPRERLLPSTILNRPKMHASKV